jgi:hypothetical protein
MADSRLFWRLRRGEIVHYYYRWLVRLVRVIISNILDTLIPSLVVLTDVSEDLVRGGVVRECNL